MVHHCTATCVWRVVRPSSLLGAKYLNYFLTIQCAQFWGCTLNYNMVNWDVLRMFLCFIKYVTHFIESLETYWKFELCSFPCNVNPVQLGVLAWTEVEAVSVQNDSPRVLPQYSLISLYGALLSPLSHVLCCPQSLVSFYPYNNQCLHAMF